jgi:DNA-directed RNA polymerase specialized sigma24 family protein
VRPWLFAIARYKLVDALRARGRRAAIDIEDVADTLVAPADEDPTVRGDVERLMARLGGRSGDIVRAIGIEGATVAEAGARFAISEGAVRIALHRGLKALAQLRTRMVE